jgi:hypothetical protein
MTEVIRGHRTQSGARSGRSSWIALGRRQSSAIKRNQAQSSAIKRNQAQSGALSGSRLAAPQSSAIKAQSSRNQVAIKLQSSRNQAQSSRNQAHLGRESRLIVHLVHLGDAPDEGGNQRSSELIRARGWRSAPACMPVQGPSDAMRGTQWQKLRPQSKLNPVAIKSQSSRNQAQSSAPWPRAAPHRASRPPW